MEIQTLSRKVEDMTILKHLKNCRCPNVKTINAIYPKVRELQEHDLGQRPALWWS